MNRIENGQLFAFIRFVKKLLVLALLLLPLPSWAANTPEITQYKIFVKEWDFAIHYGAPWPFDYWHTKHEIEKERKLTIWWTYQPEQSDDILLIQTSRDGKKWKTAWQFDCGTDAKLAPPKSWTLELTAEVRRVRLIAQNSWGQSFSKVWIDPEIK